MHANAEKKGAVIGGEYVLQYPLGGKQSTVYAAERQSDGQTVAVRVLRDLTPEIAERLVADARKAIRARHPMLASVLACDTEPDGAVFVVSEFVDGTPLSTWADTVGIPPLGTVVDFVHRLCLGLQAANRVGLTHHAIGPQNIMVLPFTFGPEGRVAGKLLDLGIPHAARAGRIDAVTAQFMAPEQLIEAHGAWSAVGGASACSNVYSVGAILYYLCTGGAPYPARTIRELLELRQAGKPLRPGRINPNIPAPLNAIMLRSLSTSASERYPSVAELAEALAFSVPNAQMRRVDRTAARHGRSNAVTVDSLDDIPTGQVGLPPGGLPEHSPGGPREPTGTRVTTSSMPPSANASSSSAPAPRGSFSSHPTPLPAAPSKPPGAVTRRPPPPVPETRRASFVGDDESPTQTSQLPPLGQTNSGIAPRPRLDTPVASPSVSPWPPVGPPPRRPSNAPALAGAMSPFPPVASRPSETPALSAFPEPPASLVTGGAASDAKGALGDRVELSVAVADEDEVTERTSVPTLDALTRYTAFEDVTPRSRLLARLPMRLVAAAVAVAGLVAGAIMWLSVSPGSTDEPAIAPASAAARSSVDAPPHAPGSPAGRMVVGASPSAQAGTPQPSDGRGAARVPPPKAERPVEPAAAARPVATTEHRRVPVRRRPRRATVSKIADERREPSLETTTSRSTVSASATIEEVMPESDGIPSSARQVTAASTSAPARAPASASSVVPPVPVETPEVRAGPPGPVAVAPIRPTTPAKPLRARAGIDALEVQGSLNTSVVRRALGRGLSDYAACYRSAAERAGRNAFRSIPVSFDIDLRGRIRHVRTGTAGLPGLAACVGKITSRLATNRKPDTGIVKASFKVAFTP